MNYSSKKTKKLLPQERAESKQSSKPISTTDEENLRKNLRKLEQTCEKKLCKLVKLEKTCEDL